MTQIFKNRRSTIETENVIPLKKTETFYLCKGSLDERGRIIEGDRVGVAYVHPFSKMFRLKIWLFAKEPIFLIRRDEDSNLYSAFLREEFEFPNLETKVDWNRIGSGTAVGNYVRIKFNLLSEEFYLCLFPDTHPNRDRFDAA